MRDEYKALRARLENDRKRMQDELDQLKSTAQSTGERREGSPFGKREEEATESLELERRLALEKQTREQLNEVEIALDKFEKDVYGLCENCGNPIAIERLEALPRAKLCLECKSLQAKNAKGRYSPA